MKPILPKNDYSLINCAYEYYKSLPVKDRKPLATYLAIWRDYANLCMERIILQDKPVKLGHQLGYLKLVRRRTYIKLTNMRPDYVKTAKEAGSYHALPVDENGKKYRVYSTNPYYLHFFWSKNFHKPKDNILRMPSYSIKLLRGKNSWSRYIYSRASSDEDYCLNFALQDNFKRIK